jgi:hypothetical protein
MSEFSRKIAMPSLSYCTVGSNDFEKAKEFYDQLLASAGWEVLFEYPSGGRVYSDGISIFGVLGPYDGRPATTGNGTMFGFKFDVPEEIRAFHAQALGLDATNDDDPCERGSGTFFGYFRDLDVNKICAYKLSYTYRQVTDPIIWIIRQLDNSFLVAKVIEIYS